MRALARSVAAAGRRVGAAADESRFRAHLTPAPAPNPTDLRPYVSTLSAYRGPTWTVDAVALVRSHLCCGRESARPVRDAFHPSAVRLDRAQCGSAGQVAAVHRVIGAGHEEDASLANQATSSATSSGRPSRCSAC